MKWRSAPPCGPMRLGKDFIFFIHQLEICFRQNHTTMWRDLTTTRQPTAHYHMSQQKELAPRFGPGWQRRPGHPRHSWIQQIGDGTPFSIRAEWSKARRRGHSGLTQRNSAVYAILCLQAKYSIQLG